MITRKSNVEYQIKECVKRISDDDLKYLHFRLSQRLGGDLGDAMTLIQDHYTDLNKVLSNATSCTELYDLVDMIDECIQDVVERKFAVR